MTATGANTPPRRDLTEGSIIKNIFHLALPMMWSNALMTVLEVVDLIWIGKLGSTAIAAVAMSGSIMMIIFTLVIGIAMGTTAIVSRYYGAKDYENANDAAMQSLITGVAVSLVGGAASYFAAPFLLKLLGAQPEVLKLGTGYLRIILCGAGVIVIMFLISAILNGAGDAKTPMKLVAGAAVLNAVLDPLLIFGIGFFPKMGVNGAALATTLSRVAGSIAGLWIIFGHNKHIQLHPKKISHNFSMIWRIVKIGIPGSAMMAIRSIMNMVLMSIVASFGTITVAAYGIIMRVEMFILMPGFGLAAAVATLVGQNLGAKKPKRAVRSAWAASGMFAAMMFVFSIIFFLFYRQITGIFSKDPEVINIVGSCVKVMVWGYAFTGIAIPLSRAMMGAGDTMSIMVATLIALWGVLIPLALVLPKKFNLGITGIWIAILVGVITHATLIVIWFTIGRWKHKKV